MTAPTTSPAAAAYLHDVRAALADLADDEREDLLEDLRGHLDELLAEEPDVDLAVRLGSAGDYADELRLAAGLPTRTSEPSPGVADRLGMLGSALVDSIRTRPAAAAVLAFLPQLRPAWWVLRAWGVVELVDWSFHGNDGYRWDVAVVPHVHGEPFLGLLLVGALAVVSVRLGPRTWTGWAQRAAVAANAVLAIATLAYVSGLGQDRVDYQYVDSSTCCQLVQPDGSVVTNIYPYDRDGRPLTDVQLFDQNGQRLDITGQLGTENDPLHNVFPQHQVVEDYSTVDQNGIPARSPAPAPSILAPALPKAASSPAVTPKPTSSP